MTLEEIGDELMGYIKIDRKILDWEWWSDVNTYRVFTYCLIRANWKETKFQGVDIPRGSFVTSLANLAKFTNLSVRQVRTALEHLKSTGELTIIRHSKFSVVIVNNYIQYQDTDNQADNQMTQERQAIDTEATTEEEYIKNNKKDKKLIKHKYGDYSHVRLTDDEYKRLVADYGEDALIAGIKNVDEYCQKKGKTYKDYNLVLRDWGIKSPKLIKPKEEKKTQVLQLRNPDDEQDALAHPISDGWLVNDDGYWINKRLGIG